MTNIFSHKYGYTVPLVLIKLLEKQENASFCTFKQMYYIFKYLGIFEEYF
jgi:hypothetical protein